MPGVVALLTDRRRVLYQGAFGVADVSTGRALTADALFRIACKAESMPATPGEFCARAAPANPATKMPTLMRIPTIFRFMKAFPHHPAVASRHPGHPLQRRWPIQL